LPVHFLPPNYLQKLKYLKIKSQFRYNVMVALFVKARVIEKSPNKKGMIRKNWPFAEIA